MSSRPVSPVRFAVLVGLVALACWLTPGRPAPAQNPAAGDAPAWPATTNETRPWTRWWWLGNIADNAMLTQAMETYRAAGIGGLEITPIYGVRGEESRFIPYLSPQWMALLDHVLAEGTRLDLGIDMATGTGWPFGGPWVDADDACKYITFKKYSLAGGQKLAEPVTFTQEQILRLVTGRRDISEIKDPIESNTNLQELAVDQVRFAKPIPLVSLMAYSGSGEVVDLTQRVGANGTLDWTTPAGDWQLYALFQGWHGKMVERAGPGGEGNVIDHFDRQPLLDYLAKFDQAFAGHNISSLRAFFNDSYEVDDANGESNWTPKFFEQFRTRRGYELRNHIPSLLGEGDQALVAKVRCDYRETISDLLLEEFTQPWGEWSAKHQALTRNQSHGAPANLLDLYAASGIPECEGNSLLRFKSATSAAHVMGKKLASAEACTWMDEHFLGNLDQTKRWIDLYFLGGVNHICYHGTMLSPENAEWPGWMFYAAVHYAPTNPLWGEFAAFNEYVTRSQSFLQSGNPDNDVLVYFPIYDIWSEPGEPGATLHQRFDGTPGGNAAQGVGNQLQRSGYSFDYISDRQIQGLEFQNGSLVTHGNRYKAVVVPRTRLMPAATLEKLQALARSGATLIFQGEIPRDVPGYHTDDRDQQRVLAVANGVQLRNAAFGQEATVGSGRVLVGDNVEALLSQVAKPETAVAQGLGILRRRNETGTVYFLLNQSENAIDGWTRLAVSAPAVALYNAQTGTSAWAAVRQASGGDGMEVYLQLAPGETRILQLHASAPANGPKTRYWTAGTAVPLTGPWQLSFVSGGPTLPAAGQVGELKSWTELSVAGVKAFSGTGKYVLTFDAPAGTADAWRLGLGEVRETAKVSLNGQVLEQLYARPFDIVIPAAALKPAGNVLEVEVSNLMANRIAQMDKDGKNYRIFYNTNFPARRAENRGADGLFTAVRWEPQPSGLLGPVTLTPLTTLNP